MIDYSSICGKLRRSDDDVLGLGRGMHYREAKLMVRSQKFSAARSVLILLIGLYVLVSGNRTFVLAEDVTATNDKSSLPDASFAKEVAALRVEALNSGISEKTFDLAFKGRVADLSVIEDLENQPEHVRAVWDYIDRAASEVRISEGQSKLDELVKTLTRIEDKFGVDRNVVVAIWGLESAYGRSMGSKNVIGSLATLAFSGGRRAAFGRAQLLAALSILESGDIAIDEFTGSWAGAMGHTQFIPTTYLAHAVDFDGDGKRNIWTSVDDALASTANYLRVSGWRADAIWGCEVELPPGFDFSVSGYGVKSSVKEWFMLGLRPVAGAALPAIDIDASVILPTGANGPAFLVTDNFRAILRYNNATAYALGIAHLSDRLQNKAPIQKKWPFDEPPLARSEREELQKLLDDVGFSSGGVDGIIGAQTRRAVRDFQRSVKLPVDGYPSTKLLDLLRKQTAG